MILCRVTAVAVLPLGLLACTATETNSTAPLPFFEKTIAASNGPAASARIIDFDANQLMIQAPIDFLYDTERVSDDEFNDDPQDQLDERYDFPSRTLTYNTFNNHPGFTSRTGFRVLGVLPGGRGTLTDGRLDCADAALRSRDYVALDGQLGFQFAAPNLSQVVVDPPYQLMRYAVADAEARSVGVRIPFDSTPDRLASQVSFLERYEYGPDREITARYAYRLIAPATQLSVTASGLTDLVPGRYTVVVHFGPLWDGPVPDTVQTIQGVQYTPEELSNYTVDALRSRARNCTGAYPTGLAANPADFPTSPYRLSEALGEGFAYIEFEVRANNVQPPPPTQTPIDVGALGIGEVQGGLLPFITEPADAINQGIAAEQSFPGGGCGGEEGTVRGRPQFYGYCLDLSSTFGRLQNGSALVLHARTTTSFPFSPYADEQFVRWEGTCRTNGIQSSNAQNAPPFTQASLAFRLGGLSGSPFNNSCYAVFAPTSEPGPDCQAETVARTDFVQSVAVAQVDSRGSFVPPDSFQMIDGVSVPVYLVRGGTAPGEFNVLFNFENAPIAINVWDRFDQVQPMLYRGRTRNLDSVLIGGDTLSNLDAYATPVEDRNFMIPQGEMADANALDRAVLHFLRFYDRPCGMTYYEIPFIVARGDCNPIAVRDRLQGSFFFGYAEGQSSVPAVVSAMNGALVIDSANSTAETELSLQAVSALSGPQALSLSFPYQVMPNEDIQFSYLAVPRSGGAADPDFNIDLNDVGFRRSVALSPGQLTLVYPVDPTTLAVNDEIDFYLKFEPAGCRRTDPAADLRRVLFRVRIRIVD